MDTRVCSKCSISKELNEFYQRKIHRSGEYYEKCKECMKTRGRSYYYKNHKRQLALALLRKRRYIEDRKKFIENFKKDKVCIDCGKIYPPWIMDFDHREGSTKIRSISWMILHDTSNFEKIKLEITKCDLVCANCHRQ